MLATVFELQGGVRG